VQGSKAGGKMKVSRLEAHDRLEHFKSDQSINIFHGAEECLKSNPDSLIMHDYSPYVYLFAHPRTAEDGVTKRMFWQPRLTRPEAQTNSYLFRAVSKTDMLEVCWLLPPKELWSQYQRGNIVHEPTVLWSINQFRFNKKQLEAPAHDDLVEEKVKSIYKMIVQNKRDANAKRKITDSLHGQSSHTEQDIYLCGEQTA